MRQILLGCLLLALFAGCRKQHDVSVEIYLLKSFTTTIDGSVTPAVTVISNAELEANPLVRDRDIEWYTQSSKTFRLSKDIQTVIRNFQSDKAFAVTVDRKPVYYGRFHPLYLSSVIFGLATISPGLPPNNELEIQFITMVGGAAYQQLDKRNDPRLLAALRASGRLR